MPGSSMRCDVWWARPATWDVAWSTVFSAFERERAEGFRAPADRLRSLTAAVLLRLVLASALDVEPDAVVIDRTCPDCGAPHGRPRVVGSALHVSVSHAGDRVAVALAGVPVGIDVEAVVAVDAVALESQVRHPLDPPTADFFTLWTWKEAVVKATGDGLRTSLSQVRIDPAGSLAEYPGRPGLVARVRPLAPGDGYAGAVALLTGNDVEVVEHDAGSLFATAERR